MTITTSKTLPAPIKQPKFARHLLTDPFCECQECHKANEWMEKISQEDLDRLSELDK